MSSVEIVGMQAVFSMMDTQLEDIHAACQAIVEETVIDTDADIKQSITSQGMVDTGRYRSGWKFNIGDLEATESNNVEYGQYLEFGTVKMRARPHVVPSFEKNRVKFVDALRKL